jgi:hypothetical protein
MSHKDVDHLLSALRLHSPGPGFAARTMAAFQRMQQIKAQKKMRQIMWMVCACAVISIAGAAGAVITLQPTAIALMIPLGLAKATVVMHLVRTAMSAAPILWAATLAVMGFACLATTVALERTLRWART